MEGNQASSFQWNLNAQDYMGAYDREPAAAQPQADAFFHPLDCEPTLQIGYV